MFVIRSEPIMILYGGSSLEAGGFVEPEVFTLMRSCRLEPTDDTSVNTYNEADISTVKSGYVPQNLPFFLSCFKIKFDAYRKQINLSPKLQYYSI